MPVRAIDLDGERSWLKTYPDGSSRRLSLALLDLVARYLGIGLLRPPAHHGGQAAKSIEARRLRELRAQGIRVPEIVYEDPFALGLSDIGPTLASRLREAHADPAGIDALTRAAIAAITDAHRAGAYFGQLVPRNITVDGEAIGFLDFEEEPLEVMTLDQAQARDWLLFAFGTARYYDDRVAAFVELLTQGFEQESPKIVALVVDAATRLLRLARTVRGLGRSARVVTHSVTALHRAGTSALERSRQ